MKLILKSAKIPALYANENKKPEDILVPIKLFNPCGQGTWYLTEYDPNEKLAFGLCDLGEPELGYVSIAELEELKLLYGMKIERDIHWNPKTTLKQVMEDVGL